MTTSLNIWTCAVDHLPPVLLHTSTQRYLLADLCAHWVGEDDLGQIGLDGADAAARGQRADVDHQHLVLRQLLDLWRDEVNETSVIQSR